MTTICQLAKRVKGSLQETEDWWHLKQGENGVLFVEHSWSHTKVNGLTEDSGERRISVEDFLVDDDAWATDARAALRDYLAKQGSGDA